MSRITNFLGKYKLQISIVIVLLVIWVLFVIGSPKAFLSSAIYTAFMTTIPIFLIMAIASTFVIISGEIDLSFPSLMGFSGWIFTYFFIFTGNIYLSFFLSLAFGVFGGFINGILRVKIGIPSLVVTIGTMFFWKGLAVVLSQGMGASLMNTDTGYTITGTFLRNIMVGKIAHKIPAQFIWAIVIAVAFGLILNRHKFGAYVRYIGDNIESAKMMGVKTKRIKYYIFMVNGFFSAFSGSILVMELSFYWPTQGTGYLLKTLSAVFVGGTSVYGGTGSIFGTFMGALIVGSLEAGIVASGLANFWTEVVYGLIIVISTAIYTVMIKQRS